MSQAEPAALGYARRVLFVHESPDGLGGSQQSMLAEAEALADAGWRIALLHGQADRVGSRISRLFDAELGERSLFDHRPTHRLRHGLRRLDGFLAAERPAGAHLQLWSNPLLLALIVRRLPSLATCHVPVCPNGARFHYAHERICEHAVGAYCVREGYRHHGCATTADEQSYGLAGFLGGLAYARWTLRLLARCERVIAPSAWQRQRLIDDGVPAERVVVIAPPIVDREGTVRVPGDTAARPVVLAAGRLVVLKGMHHLLQASARVDLPHELHIVGEGPALEQLRAVARRLGIGDRTRFVGALDAGALATAFASAQVVVVPSLWPETFGMVGPEALLAGTPVIAYEAGGVTEWATPDHGARAVAARDVAGLAGVIAEALRHPQRVRPEQRDAVRRRFSSDRHAATLLDLYERTLAR